MNLRNFLNETQKVKNIKKHYKSLSKTRKKMFWVSIFTALIIIIVLISGKKGEKSVNKMDFFVQTKQIQDFNNEIEINKPGKIVGSEEIVISSQAMGTIQDIKTQEGESVKNNSILIKLKDNLANYGIMVERAKNTLNSARLQYSQNKTQIEQGIENSKLTLLRSQSSFSSSQILGKQNIKSAENTLNNADSIKKGLVTQMNAEINKLDNLIKDVLHQNDNILGVTTQYKNNNDEFEIYLSAKNTSYKLSAKNKLLDLYKQEKVLNGLNKSSNISNGEIKNNVEKMNTIYEKISNLLGTMENVLIKSVSSTTFPQTQIDGLITSNNGLQTATQTNITYFNNFKKSVDSSIIQNKNGEFILGNESAEIGYQSTVTSTQKQVSDAKIGLETAELNYQSALKNKDSTLGLAAANIKSAELAYQEALKQYEKLNIKSPITGTIGKILVDKGQEISVGTPILTIINNADPIVEVGINTTEYQKINSGSKIEVEYMGKVLSGNIISIGSQAGTNGLYNVVIKLNKKIDIIGDTANIKIKNQNNKTTLPLNIVKPLEKNKGYIYILSGGQADIYNITLGEIRGDNIEIISKIPKNIKIITNNISNYNQNIHEIKEK